MDTKKSTGLHHRSDGFNFGRRLTPLESIYRFPQSLAEYINDKQEFEVNYRKSIVEPYFNILKLDLLTLRDAVNTLDDLNPSKNKKLSKLRIILNHLYSKALYEYDHLQTLYQFQEQENDADIINIKEELAFIQATKPSMTKALRDKLLKKRVKSTE